MSSTPQFGVAIIHFRNWHDTLDNGNVVYHIVYSNVLTESSRTVWILRHQSLSTVFTINSFPTCHTHMPLFKPNGGDRPVLLLLLFIIIIIIIIIESGRKSVHQRWVQTAYRTESPLWWHQAPHGTRARPGPVATHPQLRHDAHQNIGIWREEGHHQTIWVE